MLAGGRRGRVATAGAGRRRALPEESRRFRVGGAMEGLEGEEVKGCGPGRWRRPAAAAGPSTPVPGEARADPDSRTPPCPPPRPGSAGARRPPDAVGPAILRLPASDGPPRRAAARTLRLPVAHACESLATGSRSCSTPERPVTAPGQIAVPLPTGSAVPARGLPTLGGRCGPRVCLQPRASHPLLGQVPHATVFSISAASSVGRMPRASSKEVSLTSFRAGTIDEQKALRAS